MKVLKFGGTSVGSPERMKGVHQIITRDDDRKIVVLSAVSGTTNTLVALAEKHAKKDVDGLKQALKDFYAKYVKFVEDLYTSTEYVNKGKAVVDQYFGALNEIFEGPYSEASSKLTVVQGELISTNLFINYLHERGENASLINAADFVAINEAHEPELDKINELITPILEKEAGRQILITQGFICTNSLGAIDNLRRGGSDYSATLIGAAIGAKETQIWTDIDGMHNNDPRIVESTFPIAELSFDEAGELAYFGAKILHPNCIIPAQQKNIPVRIKNTMDPDAKGTLITNNKNPETVKAIAVKDGITAIKIKSSRMILAYGFLRKVFEVFEKYQTPIDMITTSEIAVSVTIDQPAYLAEILEEISLYGSVEVDKNQSIVCIVGDFVAERKGVGTDIFKALESIPIRMISYGGSKNNISLLIDSDYKKYALTALNKQLFGL
ncbi:MAG: aspartate kinase [Bacteroidota bacterium]